MYKPVAMTGFYRFHVIDVLPRHGTERQRGGEGKAGGECGEKGVIHEFTLLPAFLN